MLATERLTAPAISFFMTSALHPPPASDARFRPLSLIFFSLDHVALCQSLTKITYASGNHILPQMPELVWRPYDSSLWSVRIPLSVSAADALSYARKEFAKFCQISIWSDVAHFHQSQVVR